MCCHLSTKRQTTGREYISNMYYKELIDISVTILVIWSVQTQIRINSTLLSLFTGQVATEPMQCS